MTPARILEIREEFRTLGGAPVKCACGSVGRHACDDDVDRGETEHAFEGDGQECGRGCGFGREEH